MSMSDTDCSSDESTDELTPGLIEDYSKDSNENYRDPTKVAKYWKSKYGKCSNDRAENGKIVKELNIRIKDLVGIKMAYDQLKLNSDVEKRTLDMTMANEAEKANRYESLLKQSRSNLEIMVQKHNDIADLNKENEAKLYRSKRECSNLVSSIASLEEEISQLRDGANNSKDLLSQRDDALQVLSDERTILQNDGLFLKDRCKEYSHQVTEFRSRCENWENKYDRLAEERNTLKNNFDLNSTALTQELNEYQKECAKLVAERDTLKVSLSHNNDNLECMRKNLKDLQELHITEKSAADENIILLRQAELSIQHFKEISAERESQSDKNRVRMDEQLADLKTELDLCRNELQEAHDNKLSVREINKEHVTKLCKKHDEERTLLQQNVVNLTEQNKEFELVTSELNKSQKEMLVQIKSAKGKTSQQAATILALEQERDKIQVNYNKTKKHSAISENIINKLNDEATTSKIQQDAENLETSERISALKTENERVLTKHAKLRRHSANSENIIKNLQTENEELRSKISDALSHQESMSAEQSTLKEEFEKSMQRHEEEKQILNDDICELIERNGNLESTANELNKSSTEVNNLQAIQLQAAYGKIQLLDRQISEQDAHMSSLESENNFLHVNWEKAKLNSANKENTINKLNDEVINAKNQENNINDELNKSLSKCDKHESNTKDLRETLENDKIKWSGREHRYLNEIKGLQVHNSDLKAKLEELAVHYKSEIHKLSSEYEQKYSSLEEERDQKINVLETTLGTQTETMEGYQDIIQHATQVIHSSLALLNPSTPHACYLHTTRGGQSAATVEQMATLNTELGHLKATAEHLREKIKQLEEDKQLEIRRYENINQEYNDVITTKNNIESEIEKQNSQHNEEIVKLKMDRKNIEEKYDTTKRKLDESLEELTRMERELTNIHSNLADKSNVSDQVTKELRVLKEDKSVLTHIIKELKATSEQQLDHTENLKTKIHVLEEDNKIVRQKFEDISKRENDKDVICKQLQTTLNESKQEIHTEQINNIENVGKLKENFQERIHCLESEMKQVRYERDSKDQQIKALQTQINMKMEEKIDYSAVVPTEIYEENSAQYKTLCEKYSTMESTMQKLRSDKIILDNTVTQLRCNLITEKEKVAATEIAVKDITAKLYDVKNRLSELHTEYNNATNDVTRLEELLKIEQEKNGRLSVEHQEKHSLAAKLACTITSQKEHIHELKEDIKSNVSEKSVLENELAEKERMLSSEAKLRLHMTSQMSTNSNNESILENERRKCEKLKERCEVQLDQIDKLKLLLDETETAKKKAVEDLTVASRSQPNVSHIEDKVRKLKYKLVSEREDGKKQHDELTRKIKKAQGIMKEEAVNRKALTDRYVTVKAELGELHGRITFLQEDNERLMKQYVSIQSEKSELNTEKTELESMLRNDYMLKTENDNCKKNLEAMNRVELNKKLQEINCKLEVECKSREAIEAVKTATETKIRDDLEKRITQLKGKLTLYCETQERNERQFSDLELENTKLKKLVKEGSPSYPGEHYVPVLFETAPCSLSPRNVTY